jgi:predicted PolB exonuclease-like 3'-5' exonuclease
MDRRSTFPSCDTVGWCMELPRRDLQRAHTSIGILTMQLTCVLSSFSSQAKVTLHELCRVMGLPGQPDGISGAEVEKYYLDGHIREIAEYCESDVVNTYRVWLRYELFRGRLSDAQFPASEVNLVEFVKARRNTKPRLTELM